MIPEIEFFVSSPDGDIKIDERKLDFPLEGDPLKTSYRKYFSSINNFLLKDNHISVIHVINSVFGIKIKEQDIIKIIVRAEKHGALYHPASIDVIFNQGKIKFGLIVAITEIGKHSLVKEFSILNMFHKKFTLPFTPKPYLLDEVDSMIFLIEEWFEDYHEFHIYDIQNGKSKIKLWEFGKGETILSDDQNYEIYRQASMILTLYYDIYNFRLIFPWHHAAGDFVAKISTSKLKTQPEIKNNNVSVKLTTVRGYDSFMSIDEIKKLNPLVGLFYFLLHLSIQMRLDKINGIGNIVWADNDCLKATLNGFLDGLKTKKDFIENFGDLTGFIRVLKSFNKENLLKTFIPIVESYENSKEFSVINENLEAHIDEFIFTLETFLQ